MRELSTKKIKVAMIMPGRKNDMQFSQSGYEALIEVKEAYDVDIDYSEKVAESNIEQILRNYATKGYDLTIVHGGQYAEAVAKASPDYPTIGFAVTHGGGYAPMPNTSIYDSCLEEGEYLMGVIASLMTKTGKVGVIGGMREGEDYRGNEGFKVGVKTTNPEIEIFEQYVGDYDDFEACKKIALEFNDLGADVIGSTCTTMVMYGIAEVAKERGFYFWGKSSDQTALAPGWYLSGVCYKWGPIFKKMIDDVKAGTFGGKTYWAGITNGGLDLAPLHGKIPPEVREKVEQAKKAIIEGKILVKVPSITEHG